MVMDGEKSRYGTIKCRKFTGLVDLYKTIAVVSSALSQGCIPLFQKHHKEQHNFYKTCPHRRAMIRPYFVALTAGALLVVNTGTADAAKLRRSSHAHRHYVRAEPAPVQHMRTVQSGQIQTGEASYYGKAHHGKRTASGVRFDQNEMTAAHPWLPFGTQLKVTHIATGRSIIVTVNDRLPSRRRIIDLSFGAAQQLGMIRQGVAQVTLTVV